MEGPIQGSPALGNPGTKSTLDFGMIPLLCEAAISFRGTRAACLMVITCLLTSDNTPLILLRLLRHRRSPTTSLSVCKRAERLPNPIGGTIDVYCHGKGSPLSELLARDALALASCLSPTLFSMERCGFTGGHNHQKLAPLHCYLFKSTNQCKILNRIVTTGAAKDGVNQEP